MKPIISVRDLGKMYRIRSEEKKRYLTLRDELAEGFRKLWTGKLGQSQVEEFWALKDIDFDIYPGEVVGIIGRNGAGKSTLLKILSRITPPTKGEAILGGRVGSLLEVGTGFHPELTGRENIYLSGAILGMSRAEIKRKFDEIVAFAEVERFIDTPVKRYSSGMYVRLAFGVAAHLEPEILIVDEVLAVGDAQFQQKCLGKMGEVAKGGRTVLFVSHNMTAIQTLCQRAILLEYGSITKNGDTQLVVSQYLGGDVENLAERVWIEPTRAPGCDSLRLHRVCIRDSNNCITSSLDIQKPFNIEIDYWVIRSGIKAGVTVLIWKQDDTLVLSSVSNYEKNWHNKELPQGRFKSICQVPANFLNDGIHKISIIMWKDNYVVSTREDEVLYFEVYETQGGVRGDYLQGWGGAIRVLFDWNTELVDSLSV